MQSSFQTEETEQSGQHSIGGCEITIIWYQGTEETC